MSTVDTNVGGHEPAAVDLSNLVQGKKESKPSILPPALLAAKALNKKNSVGAIEITLPVMNVPVICNAFANIDETIIKTISGSMTSYNDANFKLLYDHAKFQEGTITSFEDFKQKMTEADFRTLLYGIMKASIKNLEEQRFPCKNKNCPNPDENKIFNFTPAMSNLRIKFQQENYVSPSGDHTKDLFVAENDIMTVNYKFDSIESKIEIFNSKSNDEIRNNLINLGTMLPKTELTINYIDSIEIRDGEELYKISNPRDIELFIRSLNVSSREDLEKLNDRFISHINGWIPTFSTTIICPHCNKTQEWEDIDIYIEFFRKFTAIF